MILAAHQCASGIPAELHRLCAGNGHALDNVAPAAPTDYTVAVILVALILATAFVLVALLLRRQRAVP